MSKQTENAPIVHREYEQYQHYHVGYELDGLKREDSNSLLEHQVNMALIAIRYHDYVGARKIIFEHMSDAMVGELYMSDDPKYTHLTDLLQTK